MLLHGKFKQTKVKTKIINGFPTTVYKGLEAIECLHGLRKQTQIVKGRDENFHVSCY